MEGRFFSTVHQADSVESVGEKGLFVVGTYTLVTEGDRRWREGGVLLFACDEKGEVELRQTVAGAGVLDLKWVCAGRLLAVAESEGGLSLLRRRDDDSLSETARVREGGINLSVAWMGEDKLAASHDDGATSVWNVGEAELQRASRWQAHDGEVWTVAAHVTDRNTLWTGADDGRLRGWDVRENLNKRRPTFDVRGEVGVTSIQANPLAEHVWAVGGYDEVVRVFDERNTKQPLAVSEGLGGGIWRIKWHSTNPSLMALACMRGGFRVVEFDDGTKVETRHHHNIHESEALAYGIDWLPERGRVACCSFYDARGSLFEWI